MVDSNSIVDALLQHHEKQKQQEEVVIERIEDYKLALDRIFDSSDGQLFAKYLLKYTGVFHDKPLNPAQLLEDKGRRGVYLKLIRPYLSKDVISKIENQ